MAEAGEVPVEQLADTILEVAPPHFGKNIRVSAQALKRTSTWPQHAAVRCCGVAFDGLPAFTWRLRLGGIAHAQAAAGPSPTSLWNWQSVPSTSTH